MDQAASLSMERYTSMLHDLSKEICMLEGRNDTNLGDLSGRQPFPYNLLMTSEWMLMIPRSEEKYNGISINSLGFAGSFFVKEKADKKAIEEVGPMNVLRNVAFAREQVSARF